MKKLTTVAAAVAALGMAGQAMAFSTTANVTFTWGNSGLNKGWTSSAPNSLSAMSDSTQFNSLGGANSTGYYNSDFATVATATAACAPAAIGRYRQYGCIDTTPLIFRATPATDANNVSATGTLTVTDTTLTGTLTLNATSDECVGPVASVSAPGCGTSGWNIRSADGSPFGNAWIGYGAGGAEGTTTLTVNLGGTFTDVAGSWSINSGSVKISDSNGIGCQMGNTGFAVLCNPSTQGGGYQTDGSQNSWGWDVDGAGAGTTAITEIEVRDGNGVSILDTLSGVLASLNVDGLGNITTNFGETRSALGSSAGCSTHIRWNGSAINCGTLTVQGLNVTGTAVLNVIPVPAAVWMFGSALGLLGVARRKLAA